MRRTAVLLVALGLLLLSSPGAHAQSYGRPPTIGGTPGTPDVGGTGCPADAAVGFLLDGQQAGGTTADGNGDFSGSATILPGTSPGSHAITATCGPVVQSLEISVQPEAAGAPLARTGSGSTIPLTRVALVLIGLGSLVVLFVRRRRVGGAAI
jgi:hypothetical protein